MTLEAADHRSVDDLSGGMHSGIGETCDEHTVHAVGSRFLDPLHYPGTASASSYSDSMLAVPESSDTTSTVVPGAAQCSTSSVTAGVSVVSMTGRITLMCMKHSPAFGYAPRLSMQHSRENVFSAWRCG